MKVQFADERLGRLETDAQFDGGYPAGVVKAFRKRMQMIRSAPDERDFYALRSLHFEKLKGTREGQRSMRLNDQFRLVMEIEGDKTVRIYGIEDYHR
jgi:toxin HigB-1